MGAKSGSKIFQNVHQCSEEMCTLSRCNSAQHRGDSSAVPALTFSVIEVRAADSGTHDISEVCPTCPLENATPALEFWIGCYI